MKIAVIDSGVDIESVLNQTNIIIDSGLNSLYGTEDEHGHGTMCINTIQEKYPKVSIMPIKLFDKYGSAKSSDLCYILEKLVDVDVDIICIPASFVTNDRSLIDRLEVALYNLHKFGKIVIASASNNKDEESLSYPAISKFVIGTKQNELCRRDDSYFFISEESIQFNGCGREIFTKTINNEMSLFGNNSRTCILATLKIIELYYLHNSKSVLRERYAYDVDVKRYRDIKKTILELIKSNFCSDVEIDFIELNGILNNITGIGKHNVIELIRVLEGYFEVSLLDLYYDDFRDIATLAEKIFFKTYRG